jgi:hypothetical protein
MALVGGCTSSGSSVEPASTASVIARWPTEVDTLTPVHTADTEDVMAGIRDAVPGAVEVDVRALRQHGDVLTGWIGGGESLDLDVVFVRKPGGYRPADARSMRRQCLSGMLDALGISAYVNAIEKMLAGRPYRGAGGLYGDYLADTVEPEESGGPRRSPPTRSDGTSFAFVAHGVGVVVISSSLSRAEADRVVRALQG